MQWSTDIRQIKAALFDQAFIGRTWVSCPMGRVVGIRKRRGQLLAMIYGWGRWYLSNIGFLGEGGNEGKGKISFSAMMRNQSVTHQNQEK
jgi:hypothetical protein